MSRSINEVMLKAHGRFEGPMKVWDLIQPKSSSLKKLKHISIRNRSWFNRLSGEQRKFVDATIMTVDNIRSTLLLKLLAPIVTKILIVAGNGDVKSGAFALMEKAAYRTVMGIAQKIKQIAERWGNKLASKWLNDAGFIKYLIMMNLPQNRNPSTFSITNYLGES